MAYIFFYYCCIYHCIRTGFHAKSPCTMVVELTDFWLSKTLQTKQPSPLKYAFVQYFLPHTLVNFSQPEEVEAPCVWISDLGLHAGFEKAAADTDREGNSVSSGFFAFKMHFLANCGIATILLQSEHCQLWCSSRNTILYYYIFSPWKVTGMVFTCSWEAYSQELGVCVCGAAASSVVHRIHLG